MWWWVITVHSQSQSGKRLLLASRGHSVTITIQLLIKDFLFHFNLKNPNFFKGTLLILRCRTSGLMPSRVSLVSLEETFHDTESSWSYQLFTGVGWSNTSWHSSWTAWVSPGPSSVLTMSVLHSAQVWTLTQFFSFFVKKSLICLEGKTRTPLRGNTFVFCSYHAFWADTALFKGPQPQSIY